MIQLQRKSEGFSIIFKGIPVLEHSTHSPFIFVGKGTGQYQMIKGNFAMSEELHEKVELQGWIVDEEGKGKVVVDFYENTPQTSEHIWHVIATFQERDGRLEIRLEPQEPDLNRCWLTLCATPEEKLYGGGEQYSVLNMKGRILPLWVQEKGVGRGKDSQALLDEIEPEEAGDWYTTYFPQPTFVSSENYFWHLECSAYTVCDFSAEKFHQLTIWEIPRKLIFDTRNSAPATLQSLSAYLGRQPELPDWAYDGVWLGIQGGTEILDRKVQKAIEAGVNVPAVWVQDWEGRRVTAFGKQLMWNWKYDADMYPELPAYIQRLNQQGIKFTGYINPFLALGKDLYQEASKKGYLIRQDNGEEYHVVVTTFPAALLDLTNPEAVTWIKQVIRENLIGIGLSGWMADFGDYLPADAVLHSGERAERFHNAYPSEWARVNLEAITEAGKAGEVVFFTRTGFTGESRYSTLVWAGDQLVNWSMDDGLATVIPAGISAGFAGIGFHHSDIGGFTTLGEVRRTKELFMRWAEQAAFTAVMRTHEGNRPDDNWHFDSDAETLSHLAEMSRLHVALKPYIKHCAREYTETGLPLIRHPYIHYEDDAQLHELQYQYLFGRDIMVAPVYLPSQTSWKVYLPDDCWEFLWDKAEYGQGWHVVDAPLGKPPVFYRTASEFVELFKAL